MQGVCTSLPVGSALSPPLPIISRSHPASAACTQPCGAPYWSRMACICKPSLMTSPWYPSCPRSTPWMTGADMEQGISVSSSAGKQTCDTITLARSSDIARQKGVKQLFINVSRGVLSTTKPKCVSAPVCSWPGKCLPQASTPASRRPRAMAQP